MPPAPPAQPSLPRRIGMALLALVVLVGLVILIIWLSVHPRKFHYSIEHAVISKYNLTDDRLNSNFYMVLRAENPNRRMSMYYDRIDVAVSYEDQVLSINNVHPFYQPRRNITHLDMYLVAKDALIYGGGGAIARDLRKQQVSGGALSLDVKIKAKIRQKVGVFKIHRKLKIFCGKVNVPFDTKKGFQTVFCDADLD